MSETKGRIHLAVGVFYEMDRVRVVSDALIGAGMSRSDLWRVVPYDWDYWGPAPCGIRFDRLAVGVEEDGNDFNPGLRVDPSRFFGDVMMSGGSGREIWQHLARNAIIVAAENEKGDLHDRCMKILLRYSKHPVHSQEFEFPKVERRQAL